jgi:hypothetical protein
MDLDVTQHKRHPTQSRKGGLFKAQQKKRIKKNLCLHYEKPEHRVKGYLNKQQLHAI